MKSSLIFLFAVVVSAVVPGQGAEPAAFAIEQKPNELAVTCSSRAIATYVFRDDKVLRPYFKNVHTLSGIQVTRNHPPVPGQDATDHADMHPGIWLAFGALSEQDFWRNKARVVHERFMEEPFARADEAGFTAVNRYVASDAKMICREICRIRFQHRPGGWRLLWDSTFSSNQGEFTFGDQEEMGLGVRVATPLTVKQGGAILNSSDGKNERGTWGKTADWLDYFGKVEGNAVGIMLMADPANFRPSWFHSRDYGLVVANPFGRNAFTKGARSLVVVKPDERFRLRYGLLIHESPPGRPLNREAAYQAFLDEMKPAK